MKIKAWLKRGGYGLIIGIIVTILVLWVGIHLSYDMSSFPQLP
jgi:hypothetical protein